MLLATAAVSAVGDPIPASILEESKTWSFSEGWRYRAGNDPAWAEPAFDDASWGLTTTILRPDDPPWESWKGVGWFRHRFTVEPELVGRPLLLELRQAGSSNIYVDGVSIKGPRAVLVLDDRAEHVLAVRYEFRAIDAFHRAGFPAGFALRISEPNSALGRVAHELRLTTGLQFFLTALPLAFAIIHLALFLHMPATKGNLFYAVLLVLWAATVFFDYQATMAIDWSSQLLNLRIQRLVSAMKDIALLAFVYAVLLPSMPRRLWLFAAISAVGGSFAAVKPELFQGELLASGIIITIEAIRTIIAAMRRGRRDASLLAGGMAALLGFGSYDVLLDLGLMAPVGDVHNAYFVGYIVFLICMSVFLARDFAHTHRRVLVQEQTARDKEQELQRLAEDNLRKTRELEEARELQLAMLPAALPDLPKMSLAAEMRTATEVGGDYYDYVLDENNTLTVAIGDATGHGMRAGTLVAAVKSLFSALGASLKPAVFLRRCSRLIRGLNLGRLHMAMLIVRVNGATIRVATAGIPPAQLYRAIDGRVEELAAGGLPLGTHLDPEYQETEVELDPGDTLLLCTDGFAELATPDGTALGYSGATEAFREAAIGTPSEIIRTLLATADSWSRGAPQEDDITFVVLQARDHGAD